MTEWVENLVSINVGGRYFALLCRVQIITGIGSLSFFRCQNYILVDRSDLFKLVTYLGGMERIDITAYRDRKFMAGIVSWQVRCLSVSELMT
jgi:hypothetical protein